MKVTAKPGASRRTKNRIKDHNLEPMNVTLSGSEYTRKNTLFGCSDPYCAWFGWLPNKEIEVEE